MQAELTDRLWDIEMMPGPVGTRSHMLPEDRQQGVDKHMSGGQTKVTIASKVT